MQSSRFLRRVVSCTVLVVLMAAQSYAQCTSAPPVGYGATLSSYTSSVYVSCTVLPHCALPCVCAAHADSRPRSLHRANYACRPGYAYEYGQYSINCVRICAGWLCDSQWMGTELRCFRCPTLTFMTGSRFQWDTTQTTVTQVLTAATAVACRCVPRPTYALAEY